MANVYNYTFDSLTSINDDPCYLTERTMQNNSYCSYLTTNHFLNDCGMKKPIEFATSQPNIFYNGGFGTSGAGGCNINDDSNLKIGSIQTNPKCRISLFTRPYTTVPYLGRGPGNAVDESRLQQGDMVSNKKSCTNITERSFINYKNYPLIPSLKSTIQNPSNLVEGVADEGWVQGGIPTRELIRDNDYKH